MDDPAYIDKFHISFGAPTTVAQFSEKDRARLSGRVPDSLLQLMAVDQFASYKRQSLWLCDPDSMQSIKTSWLEAFPTAEIFLRTAFGDFYFWDGKFVWACLANLSQIMYAGQNITWFFSDVITDKALQRSLGIPKFAERGRKSCGPLEADEVYFWNPSLALGGSSTESKIEKGKMDVTLDILSQLQPVNIQRIERG